MRIIRMISFGLFLAVMIVMSAGTVSANDRISNRLEKTIVKVQDETGLKVWVYFKDKEMTAAVLGKTSERLTLKATARRKSIPFDYYDLPVNPNYIDRVRQIGGVDVRPSRWLNAVSTRLTPQQIQQLAAEDFVKKIDVVVTYIRQPEPEITPKEMALAFDSALYGYSYTQNHMLGIDYLQRTYVHTGSDSALLNGAGVLIAFFDTGFDVFHPAFDSLNLIDTWDFINNDATVYDNLPTASQREHGTAVLSACATFVPGELIGPAYGADYILAKTEIVNTETQIEEDYWVQAAEWADSLGADIISTSLGYSDWYTYADMDGNTAVTTIAADIAASRGILVVNSAGNQGNSTWHFITAPADADSIVAVGAVYSDGDIASFSSYGPTYDGRIKPEVVAMGVGVRCAYYLGGYTYMSGTSLAAPLIAGSAALILQANPDLRGQPYQLRQRLIENSSYYENPDDHYGYGLPNIVAAASLLGIKIYAVDPIKVLIGEDTMVTCSTNYPNPTSVSFKLLDSTNNMTFVDLGDGTATLAITGEEDYEGSWNYRLAAFADIFSDTLNFTIITRLGKTPVYVGPNPFKDSIQVFFGSPLAGDYIIDIYALSGERVFNYRGQLNPFCWLGTNQNGQKVASGVYVIRISADGIEEKIKIMKL